MWLSIPLAWNSIYPNNMGMSQIIYICILLITTFLCSILLNANISSNMTFTPIVIFDQISSVPMELFFRYELNGLVKLIYLGHFENKSVGYKKYVYIRTCLGRPHRSGQSGVVRNERVVIREVILFCTSLFCSRFGGLGWGDGWQGKCSPKTSSTVFRSRVLHK